jgi:hypothetical protein
MLSTMISGKLMRSIIILLQGIIGLLLTGCSNETGSTNS